MRQSKIIPADIRRFNWGALLLTLPWAIRHGVWIGLLTVVPIFGWVIMPLILGFRGNVWAWRKNDYSEPDVSKFLKSQKYWAISAVLIYVGIGVLMGLSGRVLYSTVRIGTDIANQNDRVRAYFGSSIESNWLNCHSSYVQDLSGTVRKTTFGVKNSEKPAKIELEFFENGNHRMIKKLSIHDDDGEIVVISPVFNSNMNLKSTHSLQVVKQWISSLENNHGNFLIARRSEKFNDFIQTQFFSAGEGQNYFVVEYHQGHRLGQPEAYRYQIPITNKNDVIDLFYAYLGGTDQFKKNPNWQKSVVVAFQKEAEDFVG